MKNSRERYAQIRMAFILQCERLGIDLKSAERMASLLEEEIILQESKASNDGTAGEIFSNSGTWKISCCLAGRRSAEQEKTRKVFVPD